jgi:hypothetical protein
MPREKLIREPQSQAEDVRDRLIVDRVQAQRMLGGVSESTLLRLERERQLTPIKLSRRPASKTYYSVSEIHALAAGRRR